MNYILNSDKQWILCTCKANTPNTNLHSNIQNTALETEQNVAAAPPTILEHSKTAVAAPIKILMSGPCTAAAVIIIITLVLVAVGLISITIGMNGSHVHIIVAGQSARKATRCVIPMIMIINRISMSKNLHIE